MTPIHLASTFAQQAVGEHKGFDYSRTRNPTRVSLETTIASLEGADHGFAFSSGMAAVDAVLRLLRPGDHLLIPNDAYGGTYRLVAQRLRRLPGSASRPSSCRAAPAIEAAWRDETRLVWMETPSNPKLHVIDIEAVAAHRPRPRGPLHRGQHLRHAVPAAPPQLRRRRRRALVDQVPGRSLRCRGRPRRHERRGARRAISASSRTRPGPCRARSTATSCSAASRPWRCASTASARTPGSIAEHLARPPGGVAEVYYPGLAQHPGHELARRQMLDFGAMVSFTLFVAARTAP